MAAVESIAVRFHQHGEPLDVLREERIDVGDPPPDRVRVRVAAVGLNPADWELCRGFMAGALPRGIGYDVSGVVDALGPDVADVALGDLVFGTADFLGQPSAGVAEVALLDRWYPVPDGLDAPSAAVMPMVVQTAVWTLDAMGLARGDLLVVNGGGSAVGFAAVQIAVGRGLRVIATAGPTFADDLRRFGARITTYGEGVADRVLALADGPVDGVLDASRPMAGTVADLIAITSDPGRVMTISNHDEARRLGARVNLEHITNPAPPATILPEYAGLASRGEFRLPLARAFPLREWRDAVELSLSGHPHGKVVLLPGTATTAS